MTIKIISQIAWLVLAIIWLSAGLIGMFTGDENRLVYHACGLACLALNSIAQLEREYDALS